MSGERGFGQRRTGAINFKTSDGEVTLRSRHNVPAKFPPDVVRLCGSFQGIFVDVVEDVFLTLDLELGVFFVAEALVVVEGDL